jgi:hypothetical protein
MALEPPPPPEPIVNVQKNPDGDSVDSNQADKPEDRLALATVERLFRRMQRSVADREKRSTFSQWLAEEFVDYHRQVLVEALSPIIADADVLVDGLLPDLADELRAVMKEDIPAVWQRAKDNLLAYIKHGIPTL